MTCSTSYCLCDTPMDPRNVCACVCVYAYELDRLLVTGQALFQGQEY